MMVRSLLFTKYNVTIASTLTTTHLGIQIGPITPISPIGLGSSAPSSPGAEGKVKKKTNPLTDLIETEKVYVDLLTGIMRVCKACCN